MLALLRTVSRVSPQIRLHNARHGTVATALSPCGSGHGTAVLRWQTLRYAGPGRSGQVDWRNEETGTTVPYRYRYRSLATSARQDSPARGQSSVNKTRNSLQESPVSVVFEHNQRVGFAGAAVLSVSQLVFWLSWTKFAYFGQLPVDFFIGPGLSSLGVAMALGLCALVRAYGRRKVSKLQLVGSRGDVLRVTTYGFFGVPHGPHEVLVSGLSGGNGKGRFQTFRQTSMRTFYVLDTERGVVGNAALINALVTNPDNVLGMMMKARGVDEKRKRLARLQVSRKK